MNRWAAIIGAKGAGKSTHAVAVANELRRRGIRVGGFVQEAWHDELDRRNYDLVRLSDSRRLGLARPTTGVDELGRTTFCSYSFDDDAFASSHQWLHEDLEGGVQVVLIDEVSKLEAAGQGHYDAIRTCLSHPRVVTVLCIRADQSFYVVDKLQLSDDPLALLEIPPSSERLDAFVDAIIRATEQ